MRATRLFIRGLVRACGYRASSVVLGAILTGRRLAGKGRLARYVPYLIQVNKLRIDYLDVLTRNDLHGAVRKKIQWAEFVARESRSLKSRLDAKAYLSLLAKHGCYAGSAEACMAPVSKGTDRIFYIYGPNASARPSVTYAESTLVLTKPIDVDVSLYRDSLLFINSMYFSKLSGDAALRDAILGKYGRVFVSCREAQVEAPFTRSSFSIGDHIASPMALGRVLYNLIKAYGKFRCVIEGFDLYIQPGAYASYYPHLARNKDSTISERVICKALADHDALYNFLYVKELLGQVDLVDSEAFRAIMQLDAMGYLDKLAAVRDFRSLR